MGCRCCSVIYRVVVDGKRLLINFASPLHSQTQSSAFSEQNSGDQDEIRAHAGKPQWISKPVKNTGMERQFNRQYCTRNVQAWQIIPCSHLSRTTSQLNKRKGAKAGRTRGISEYRWVRRANQLRNGFAGPYHDQTDDLQTLFKIFDLEPPSPQQTVTTMNQGHRGPVGPVEPNQGEHQPRRPSRTRRRPRRLDVEPRRRTYDSASS
ncbi:hypothetical protein Tcan_18183 [Toxocara canis]|uniref:Uncharacterized protein n=1 Tax=Toxocara canis TaxID=6265 RepID=A0A0B2V4S5_TOXCA|nr:hypothetical protein Tcan_18183 [Toxocara canis]